MHQINMHEAKSTLSLLVEEALSGEEVVIAKSGDPVVRLVPYRERIEPRRPGRWRGRVWIAKDFDETPREIVDAFEGKE
ncbi:MAG: hypothetical protein A2286_04775 [Gammaproteobacteria bacterium RIFOXYA12_FULL_61_12]|nr:MAG: hypothetical protein A2514_12615 [Gammaproteobacteria bacterium RIFOXYD12_FULL_61_37]OGT94015.1 MAG: hypothetical protein A2286_04775 [Gammaproteobacteria bacterium RIFOXYA12_FULL_61_12]